MRANTILWVIFAVFVVMLVQRMRSAAKAEPAADSKQPASGPYDATSFS